MDKERLLKETIVLLSADLFSDIYEIDGNWGDTTDTIIELAEKFEEELDWQENDERDYIEELERFEKKVLEKYRSEKGAATSQ